MAETDWEETRRSFARWLLTHGKSPDTASTYSGHLRPFWIWASRHELTPADAPHEALELWLAEELTSGRASSTAHVRLSAVKAYYASIGRPDNPAFGLTVKKEETVPLPPLSDEAEAQILAVCETEDDQLMFLLGFDLGLRVGEIAKLECADVFARDGLVRLRGKGKKQRMASAPAALSLRLLARAEGRHGPLFEMSRAQVRNRMQTIARWAGVHDFLTHGMRRCFAHRFYEKYRDLDSLQYLLGHASADTTRRYIGHGTGARALDLQRRLLE